MNEKPLEFDSIELFTQQLKEVLRQVNAEISVSIVDGDVWVVVSEYVLKDLRNSVVSTDYMVDDTRDMITINRIMRAIGAKAKEFNITVQTNVQKGHVALEGGRGGTQKCTVISVFFN